MTELGRKRKFSAKRKSLPFLLYNFCRTWCKTKVTLGDCERD